MSGKKREELFVGEAIPHVEMKRRKYKSVEGEASKHGKLKLAGPHVKNRHGMKKYGEMLPEDMEFSRKNIKGKRPSSMVVEGRHKSGYGRRQRQKKGLIVDQRKGSSRRRRRHHHAQKEREEIPLETEGKSIEDLYAELMSKIKIDPSKVPTSPRALKEWMEYVVEHRNEFPRIGESSDDEYYYSEEEEEEEAPEVGIRIAGHQRIPVINRKKSDAGQSKTDKGKKSVAPSKSRRSKNRKNSEEVVLSSRKEEGGANDNSNLDSSRGQPLHRIRGRANPQHRRTLGRKKDQKPSDAQEEEAVEEAEEDIETIDGMPEIVEVEEGDGTKVKRVRRRRKRKSSHPEEEEKPNHLLRDDEDDEAELLERLMQQTTDALEMNNYDDLGALERPHLFRSESGLQKRPTALGRKVDYVKAKDRLRHVPRYRFFTFDGEKLRILNRSISVDSKKKPFIERRKLYTLGRVDIGEGPKIMMTYKHPTIWDFSKGKIRRNSFS